ncbi:preprotein translocase subunit YajC [Fibrobacter sp. UWEL]|uniref:preprotein translocase subunit YajC n=1 Tax=Fibrobacter sp. UWEL TaxID=1896209 RepID=UPI000912296F|nr:preprotein translocase subunit YajC [Fibrobacter sp. UWEL]SHK54993.1 preprotein translocase, YajC subunit [Fibrobacter sp. UWEL]
MKIKLFLAALLTAAAFTFAEGEAAPAAAPAAPTLSAAPAAEGSLAAAAQQDAPAATATATEAAAPAAEQEQPSMLGGMMPIILLFVVMWLFFIRPKNKEMKQQEAMRKSLKKGDKVMTAAGIIGVVTNIDETSTVITVRTGSTTLIDFEKAAVLRVLNAEAKPAEAKTEEKK